MDVSWIITIMVAVIAAVPGVAAYLGQRGKNNADTAKTYEELAGRAGKQIMDLNVKVEELQERVDGLECQLAERDRMIQDWQEGINRLINQLESHQLMPVWRPKNVVKGAKAQ